MYFCNYNPVLTEVMLRKAACFTLSAHLLFGIAGYIKSGTDIWGFVRRSCMTDTENGPDRSHSPQNWDIEETGGPSNV